MRQVLVLGGGGFIGSNIVESLVNRGDCYVTAADIREGFNWREISKDKDRCDRFRSVQADFTNIESFEKLQKNFDEVYMLAAIVGVNRTLKYPQDVIRVNSLLTSNTLDWISRNPINRLLFASSSENYAGTSDLFEIKIPTPEDVPLCIGDIKHPRWTYAVTKIHGESSFIHSASALGFECTIVRYQNIIGPNMGFGHAIPHIVERFVRKEESPYKIYGHDQTRAFCYIDDAVKATISAMELPIAAGEIYHIGNEQEITMRVLTEYIGKLLNYSGEYENALTYPGSVERRCPDISKAARDLEYTPSVHWQSGVKKTVQWYREYFESGQIPPSGGFEPPEMIIREVVK